MINGGPVNATSASVVNLTIGSSGSLVFPTGLPTILNITGTSILNNGSISLAGSDGLDLDSSNTVTLSGSGSVTMAGNNFTGSGGSTLIVQQPVHGFGVFSSGASLNNQNVISASGGTLLMQPVSAVNTGTIEASSGGTLTFPNGSPVSWNNTGGTIKALDGGTVNLDDGVYTGGTLTTVGTGLITGASAAVLNNLTNSGTFQVRTSDNATLENIITNTGSIEIPSTATLFVTGNVTLTGAGSLVMSGPTAVLHSLGTSDSITNQQLIHGFGNIGNLTVTNKGTISADSSGNALLLAGSPTTNTSTMQASGGGILHLNSASPVLNVGGVIQALSGSTVVLEDVIKGGTLTTSGTGTIQSENGTLDGTVNIPTNSGKLIAKNFDLFIQGTVNNTGTISLSGGICVILNQPSTLTGSGRLMMVPTTCIFGSGLAFTNESTILGAGSIGDSNPMPITNGTKGTIMANSKSPLIIEPDATGFTNTGKLIVNAGSTLTINGLFNTLSSTGTLMAGTYQVSGTLGLQNSIITNDASLTLSGSTAKIVNNNTATDALQTLTTNASTGLLSLQKGRALTTNTSLSNAGKIVVGTSSSLTLIGSYTQTGGTTTVDGTITAPTGLTFKGGTVVGSGTLAAAVTSDALITAGDSTTKPAKITVNGSYTQNSAGTLNISIGGTAAGKFGELAVSNGVSLGGTLSIKLVNGFVPTVGTNFTIVTGTAVTNKFATVKGTSINSSEHFQVNYNPTSVTLSVVSGP